MSPSIFNSSPSILNKSKKSEDISSFNSSQYQDSSIDVSNMSEEMKKRNEDINNKKEVLSE
ncbi:hypothetical protein RF031_02720, partial [Acinetobacter baumannii]|nr:hypothetical protein [Acinetobacter baumannii]